ncbi:hypothetical protein CAOG_009315 [Capsaspora owczarzaki ATCC 30864]|uniref:Uncharacterized protein n=1 Tax=Capsaspora owczarzaki (strain ATCC 30864) TaxID=595528 RepID=A0A0D2WIN1_CAPO3|nr:hypothetical protein CAOG_009315 [Capsaspora owczarzaki ATCC 30864]
MHGSAGRAEQQGQPTKTAKTEGEQSRKKLRALRRPKATRRSPIHVASLPLPSIIQGRVLPFGVEERYKDGLRRGREGNTAQKAGTRVYILAPKPATTITMRTVQSN